MGVLEKRSVDHEWLFGKEQYDNKWQVTERIPLQMVSLLGEMRR